MEPAQSGDTVPRKHSAIICPLISMSAAVKVILPPWYTGTPNEEGAKVGAGVVEKPNGEVT